jgi:XTP/dITP diphosphohydrolase
MKLYFVTSSESKIREVAAWFEQRAATAGAARGEPVLQFSPVRHDVQEIMHPDLEVVVRYKALEAYKYLRQPCLVEHGGLFFEGLQELPGPLGKIIWSAVGERMCGFLREGDSRRAIARAHLGYCDGRQIHVFRGETAGSVAVEARGDYNRHNWDPIFIPDGETDTYGEMGAERKSVSSPMLRAWEQFVEAVGAGRERDRGSAFDRGR